MEKFLRRVLRGIGLLLLILIGCVILFTYWLLGITAKGLRGSGWLLQQAVERVYLLLGICLDWMVTLWDDGNINIPVNEDDLGDVMVQESGRIAQGKKKYA